ncbi:hypothetical protein OG911_28155 [Streptomyces sp. NBC_00208]|uniref:hypothetical protein n=1 Tax=Streptomyces sp. NBC_00208 TaxID=2975681 RepID=UPI002E2B4BBA|nr:hypothetical protein [Streptomyces sp. NBC_00208]
MNGQLPPGIAAKLAAAADHATSGTCPQCGAAVLTARAGRVAALDVIADAEPIDTASEIRALLEGRLTWHLVTGALGTRRITWRTRTQIRAGPSRHPVIADHACPRRPVQEALL